MLGKQEFLNPQQFPFATDVWRASYRRGQMTSYHMNLLQMTVAHGLPALQLMLIFAICTAFRVPMPLWGHKALNQPQATAQQCRLHLTTLSLETA
jgi:hypothetical protein